MTDKQLNLDWQELQSDWMKQKIPLEEKSDLENRLNDYFVKVRKKERWEIVELLFDIILGGLVIWLAVSILNDTFTFFWPLPTKEMMANYTPSLFSADPADLLYSFYGMLIFGIGLLLIGCGIPLLSIKLRSRIWKSDPIYEMSSRKWTESYLNNKIKQTQIGKLFAVSYFILFSGLYLFSELAYDRPGNPETSISLYRMVLFVSFWGLFPLSIYILSEWQKRKFVKKRNDLFTDN